MLPAMLAEQEIIKHSRALSSTACAAMLADPPRCRGLVLVQQLIGSLSSNADCVPYTIWQVCAQTGLARAAVTVSVHRLLYSSSRHVRKTHSIDLHSKDVLSCHPEACALVLLLQEMHETVSM